MFALYFQNITIKFLSLETIVTLWNLKTKLKSKLLTIKEPLQLKKQIITKCSLLTEHSGKMWPFVWGYWWKWTCIEFWIIYAFTEKIIMQMFINEHNDKIRSWQDWNQTRAATPTDLTKTTCNTLNNINGK